MLKKEQYLKTVRRPYLPLFCTLLSMGYANKKQFKNIVKEPFSITDMAHVNNTWYYGKANYERGGQLALKNWRDKSLFEFVQKEFQDRADSLVNSAKLSFEEFCDAYQRYMPVLSLISAIGKPTEIALRNALSQRLSTQVVEELMDQLNIPLQDNFYKQEEYDLVVCSNLEEHVEKYRWLYSRYGEEKEYTLEEAKNKLKSINNKDEFLQKREEGKNHLRQVISQAKDLLGDDDSLVDIFQYIIYCRTQRTDILNKSAFIAIPMLKLEAKSFDLTYEQLLRCSAEEILRHKIPPKEILESRTKDCSTILEDGKVRCHTGEESKKLIEFFSEKIDAVSEFKGTVACKGNVKGAVKVIIDKNDFAKIEEGNILVTSMTTPDMVPILKKAAAFVTDEGGVTCHAAIISREMHKPCIIGTKIATKVLKDGDLVEVDADKGIVKIIKKA